MSTTAPAALPMKIKCVGPFAGSKRRLAPRIVELLGPHDTYTEPMVGGCSILPVKPRVKYEFLNDANHNVVRVLRAMQDRGPWLSEQLDRIAFDRDQFHFSRGWVAARGHVMGDAGEAAATALHQLIVWWMGPGGIAGTTRKPWFAQRKTKTGGDPAVRWESFKASLPALCERLKGVEVQWNPWSVFAQRRCQDSPAAAYYVDPPYLEKTFRYQFDFAEADHQRLADWLNRFEESRVVVSYYDDGAGTLARLYPPGRWRRIDVELPKNMSAASGTTGRATEVLLVNDVGK